MSEKYSLSEDRNKEVVGRMGDEDNLSKVTGRTHMWQSRETNSQPYQYDTPTGSLTLTTLEYE